MLWNCQCTFYGIFLNDLYNNKIGWKPDISARIRNFLFSFILYIVLVCWLILYFVLHFPCNWFLCTSFYGDTGRNICMRHNPALHTLLSLYDCASSITTPCKWYTAGFYFGKFYYLFSEQEWHGFTGNCGRQKYQRVIPAFLLPESRKAYKDTTTFTRKKGRWRVIAESKMAGSGL